MTSPPPPHALLSEKDVHRLLTEREADVRIDVLEKIAGAHRQHLFNPRELAIAEQVYRLLLRDAEVRVRKMLAENLKDNPDIPHDIISKLARDVEEVALPVIRYSDVLTDSDLVDIIENSEAINRQLAVAARRKVSDSVSAALISTGNDQVVETLVKNEGAHLSDGNYQQIMTHFIDNSQIIGTLATRPALPVTVVEKLITIVSDALGQELKGKYQLSGGVFSAESDQTRELATLQLVDDAVRMEDVERLVNHLYSHGRLTSSIIFSALCRGNLRFFEMALAKLAGVPPLNARLLINDRGELGFAGIYEKADMPESMFAAAKLLLLAVKELQEEAEEKPGTLAYANRVAEKLLFYAEGKEVDNLSYILALIRQNVRH